MRRLWLDFETRSYIDLKKCGLDRYAKDKSTEVLMLAWAFDDDPVKLWVPIRDGQPMPEELKAGLTDPTVVKMAFNYNFEKAIFEYRLLMVIPQNEWTDPAVRCADIAFPTKLEKAADALDLDIDSKKIVYTGKTKPTKMFSEPSKRTKTYLKKNPTAMQFYYKDWTSDPERWTDFEEYCKQDVVAERAVWYATLALNCPMTDGEMEAWRLDQRMNRHGVYIDQLYVAKAKALAIAESDEILGKMKELTGLENPNSTTHQLKPWLKDRNYPFDSCDKEAIDEAIKGASKFGISPLCLEVLQLKQKLGGSAYKKLQSIEDRVSQADGYLRDQFVFHGAHTGRWSGRGVQLQNLFKPNKDVSTVRDAVVNGIKAGNLDLDKIVAEYNASAVEFNKTNTDPKKERKPIQPLTLMAAVAGTIRAAFIPTPEHKFSVSDLAQIESRVLAALAGCQTMIDAYAKGLDLYKDIMSFLLEKPYDQIDSKERANGKVIILGCGFSMGWEKFIEYAATFGVTLDEKTAKKYVTAFREKYSEIPSYWKELNEACLKAVKLNVCVYVRGVVVDGRNPVMLKIKLPSDRCLHYYKPEIVKEMTEWGAVRESIQFLSWDEKGLQTKRLYGGLICENIVQAVARDILLNGMLEAEKIGFVICMTIHDEVVAESPVTSKLTYKDLEHAMTITPAWAEGLGFVLAAEGYDCFYYRK